MIPSGMDIVFIDETFDINQTKNYHISIQAGLNGYSFSVLDTIRNKYILLKHFPFTKGLTMPLLEDKVAEINSNDEFLSREYRTVFFSFQSPRYTIIPGPLFKKDSLKTYFEFNHIIDDLDEIHYNGFKNIDAFNLFAIPSGLCRLMYKAFVNVRFFHQATSLVEYGLMHHGGKNHDKIVMVNLHGNYIDIVVVQGDKLLFCNTFPWKTEQDLIYFILYVYEQLKLSGEHTPVVISGELQKKSTTYDLLKLYLKRINFERRDDHFIYSYTFNEIDVHWFTNLFNLRMCV
jgi:hypothetical protein